jgi:hypothetical protein
MADTLGKALFDYEDEQKFLIIENGQVVGYGYEDED